MKLIFPAAALALVACGGATTNEFRANAPTYDKFAISQNDGDEATPTAEAPAAPLQQAMMADTCHPHLFQRTGEIIGRVNRHFFKLTRHVEELIRNNPALASGETKTWENVRNGIDRKLTITATANLDGSITYDFELDVAAASATPSFVKVMTGSITHIGPAAGSDADAGTATLVENKGTATFDFTALASVDTSERARGQITDTFDNRHDPVKGVKRTATIALTNFLPEEGDPHGPRNGTYAWEREPGTGGKFQFQDSVVLFCPDNPTLAPADLNTVARWYRTSDGAVHGRSDSRATGGQFAGNTWIGVTCANGASSRMAPPEGYWLMKLEDPSGVTVTGMADTAGDTPCDPIFGAVPNLNDNKNDYDFSQPVTFPNEW